MWMQVVSWTVSARCHSYNPRCITQFTPECLHGALLPPLLVCGLQRFQDFCSFAKLYVTPPPSLRPGKCDGVGVGVGVCHVGLSRMDYVTLSSGPRGMLSCQTEHYFTGLKRQHWSNDRFVLWHYKTHTGRASHENISCRASFSHLCNNISRRAVTVLFDLCKTQQCRLLLMQRLIRHQWSWTSAVCHNLFCRGAASIHCEWSQRGRRGRRGRRGQINEEEEGGWSEGEGALSSARFVCVCVWHPVSSELSAVLFHAGERLHADMQLPLLS